MNDHEIVLAALCWYTTHERRMAASSALYASKKAGQQKSGCFSFDDSALSTQVTEAKRLERAALRKMARLCEEQRGCQIEDAFVPGTRLSFYQPPVKEIDACIGEVMTNLNHQLSIA